MLAEDLGENRHNFRRGKRKGGGPAVLTLTSRKGGRVCETRALRRVDNKGGKENMPFFYCEKRKPLLAQRKESSSWRGKRKVSSSREGGDFLAEYSPKRVLHL